MTGLLSSSDPCLDVISSESSFLTLGYLYCYYYYYYALFSLITLTYSHYFDALVFVSLLPLTTSKTEMQTLKGRDSGLFITIASALIDIIGAQKRFFD